MNYIIDMVLTTALKKLASHQIEELHILHFENSLNDYKIIMEDNPRIKKEMFHITVQDKAFSNKEYFDSNQIDISDVRSRFHYLDDNIHSGGYQTTLILENKKESTLRNKFRLLMWQLKLHELNEVNIYIRKNGARRKDAYKFQYVGNNYYRIYGTTCLKNWDHNDAYDIKNYKYLGTGTLAEILRCLIHHMAITAISLSMLIV